MDDTKSKIENSGSEIMKSPQMDDNILLEKKVANILQTNSVVVKTIFSFLSVEDIKNGRLVCSNWADIADPLLRKRSKIIFDFSSGRTHVEFAARFSLSQSDIKFSSFKFSEGDWPKYVVDDFFEKQRRNVRELEFNNVILKDESNEEVHNPSIDDWVRDLPIRKLGISCGRNWDITHNLMVSLDLLRSVEELVLDKCKVHVRQGDGRYRIAPLKVKLNNVTFCNSENFAVEIRIVNIRGQYLVSDIIDEILINDLMELKKAKSIEIKCPPTNSFQYASQIILSLETCENLLSLQLTAARVVNWGRCNLKWLSLDGIPYLEKNALKVQNMCFQQSSIDLCAISPDIVQLLFGHYRNTTTNISCTQPVYFPDLKSLKFYGLTVHALPHFKNCPKLLNLFVSGQHEVLNLNWIPRSIKRLEMGFIGKILGDLMEIEWLVLIEVSLDEVEQILHKIKPQHLVFEWRINVDNDCKDRIIFFLNKFKHLKSISIGPFYISENTKIRESRLHEFVDKKSNYYVFASQRGVAISHEDFQNF